MAFTVTPVSNGTGMGTPRSYLYTDRDQKRP